MQTSALLLIYSSGLELLADVYVGTLECIDVLRFFIHILVKVFHEAHRCCWDNRFKRNLLMGILRLHSNVKQRDPVHEAAYAFLSGDCAIFVVAVVFLLKTSIRDHWCSSILDFHTTNGDLSILKNTYHCTQCLKCITSRQLDIDDQWCCNAMIGRILLCQEMSIRVW